MIFRMELKPGETVSEYAIAEKLKVSRTPVREAFKRLEQEGLIISTPSGRKKVFVLTTKDVELIFDLKEILESGIVKWAVERGSDDDIKQLELVTEKMLSLFESNKEGKDEAESELLKKWLQLDVEFHELLYKMAGNPRAEQIIKNLNNQWQRLRQAILVMEGRMQKSSEEHLRIAQAITQRNSEEAERKMKEHLLNIRKMLVSMMRAFHFPEY